MGWRAIARKDIQDASRSRSLWIVIVLFLVLTLAYMLGSAIVLENTLSETIDGLAGMLAILLPVIAILLGYKSVAHERINGSIVLLLSFPHSRRDLVIGKYIGRSVVLIVPAILALALAGVAGSVLFDSVRELVWYPWFVLVTALYGLSFLSIALAISMSSTTDRRITLGAFGAYLLLVSFWDNIVTAIVVVLFRFDFDVLFAMPDWSQLATLLKPSEAYYRLLHLGFELERGTGFLASDAPWYVDWWVALLILGCWIGVPLVLGYRRFTKVDL